MAVIPNIVNMFAGINERKRAKREREALENYLNDPVAAEEALMDSNVNPQRGMELRQKREAEAERKRDKGWAMFTATAPLLRGVEDPEEIGAVLDGLSPALTEYMGPQGFGNLRTALMGDPSLATRMDADAWKAIVDRDIQPYTLQAGQQRFVGNKEVAAGRYKRDVVNVPRADGGVEVVLFDPNVGEFVLEDGTPAPPEIAAQAQRLSSVQRDFDAEFGADGPAASAPQMTVEAMRPIFMAQESGGDYTAVNAETGAMGAYQVMPETGAALAARLGMVWNPKLMTSNTEEGRRYQDAIGGAAIQEAIQASGGDPRTMAMYYHGGSDRNKWGPRTRKYGDDILNRMGAGGGAPAQVQSQPAPEPRIGRTRISAPGRQDRFRAATPEELRGYPAGTAAQVDVNTGKLVNIVQPPAPRAPSAATVKQAQQEEARAQATGMTSNILQDMARSYVKLSDMDTAIVDSRRGAGNNISAWINSSSLGQALAGMAGSEAQSIRQQINQSRPLLLNQIRQASEMGARGLDSNKELEFYLQAATDPGRELIANFAALHILDVAYGRGDALARSLPPDLFEVVDDRARILASEQGSDYLFQNTGRTDAPASAGQFTVRRKPGQ